MQLGVGIPIFNRAQKAKIRAAKEKENIAAAETALRGKDLNMQLQENWNAYLKYQDVIRYYQHNGLTQAAVMMQTANLAYKNGEIGYVEWGTVISNAIGLQSQYVDAVHELNLRRIELEYLLQ